MFAQQMQAKRDAAAAAAEVEQNDENDDDNDVNDGGQRRCAEAGTLAAVLRSPSGDSFTMLATENQLDKRVVGDSRLELPGLHDRLSVTSVHTPADYVALPTVCSLTVFSLASLM